MNSLMSYGSDDDLDDSPEEKSMDSYGTAARNYRKLPVSQQQQHHQQHRYDDTNYDEVQMSCSEDSDAETKSSSKYGRDRDDSRRTTSPRSRDPAKDTSQRDRRDDRWDKDRYGGRDRNDDRSRNRDDERSKSRDDDRSKSRDDNRSKSRDDDRSKSRDDKDDRNRSRVDDDRTRDRGDRYKEKDDDKLRDRRDDRSAKSRERYSSRDDRYRQDRDRKRSRSPRDNRDRDRRRSRSPRRSRSRSRERIGRGGFQRRFDRANRMDKNASDPRANPQDAQQNDDTQNKDRFFMPGITGRFKEQIEKRKLLWQKKEPQTTAVAPGPAAVAPRKPTQNPNAPRATKVWESTTFAQDTDGKVANKFKRLMGIRTPGDANKSANEVLKKQDEMFSAMEQQYEVARTTTHTMRGVGLGFSSFNR